jgi:uncharacterized membrane protein YoaK (UPF0700 family)
MKPLGWGEIRDLLLLSFAAGTADAAGYLGLGRLFTCNMTGNVVLLGIAVGQGHFSGALRTLGVLAVFLIAAGLGTWLGRCDNERMWPRRMLYLVGLEAAVLVPFALGWFAAGGMAHGATANGLLALLAFAMGLQSATMLQLGVPGVGTTAVTKTMTSLMAGLTRFFPAWRKRAAAGNPANRQQVEIYALVVALYGIGAAITAVLMGHALRWAGMVPALTLLLIFACPRGTVRSRR